MGQNVLLFHHTHTADSNRFEKEVRGLRIDSHATDYVTLVDRLPAGQDALFVKTEHWKTEPQYFDRLETRLEARGSKLTRFDTHVYFELGGSGAAIINGVEAAVERQQNHLTICGLPLESNETYTALDIEDLAELAADAAWIAPAHIGMPFHHIPPDLMESVCELSTRPEITLAIGYTTGYFRIYNRISRNEIPGRTSVRDYARRFGLSLVPELDLHAVVPEGFSGCGVVDPSVMDDLRAGEIPVAAILRADLFRPSGCYYGTTKREFLRNYATFVPFVEGIHNSERSFEQSLPETEWLRELDISANTVPLR